MYSRPKAKGQEITLHAGFATCSYSWLSKSPNDGLIIMNKICKLVGKNASIGSKETRTHAPVLYPSILNAQLRYFIVTSSSSEPFPLSRVQATPLTIDGPGVFASGMESGSTDVVQIQPSSVVMVQRLSSVVIAWSQRMPIRTGHGQLHGNVRLPWANVGWLGKAVVLHSHVTTPQLLVILEDGRSF